MARYRDESEVDGRWSRQIQPVMVHEGRGPYKLACCDCGLVHDILFWIEGDHVRYRIARNNRATGQVRRHMKTPGGKKACRE